MLQQSCYSTKAMDLTLIDCRDFWQTDFEEQENVEWGNHAQSDLFNHRLFVCGVPWYTLEMPLDLHDLYCIHDVIAIIIHRKYSQNFRAEVVSGRDNIYIGEEESTVAATTIAIHYSTLCYKS